MARFAHSVIPSVGATHRLVLEAGEKAINGARVRRPKPEKGSE